MQRDGSDNWSQRTILLPCQSLSTTRFVSASRTVSLITHHELPARGRIECKLDRGIWDESLIANGVPSLVLGRVDVASLFEH